MTAITDQDGLHAGIGTFRRTRKRAGGRKVSMEIKRNAEGEVSFDNGLMVKVPKDQSFISVLGVKGNSIIDGGEFKDDHYIWVGENRVKKWFKSAYDEESSGHVRVWPPAYENLEEVEARRWRMVERSRRFIEKYYRPASKAVMEVGQAHAQPTHDYKGKDRWWIFEGRDHGVSFNWVEGVPDPILHHEIGQCYYHAERMLMRNGGFVYRFNVVLSWAIARFLRSSAELEPKDTGRTLRLVLNDRNYWYVSGYRGPMLTWIKMAWPEGRDNLIEVRMGGGFA